MSRISQIGLTANTPPARVFSLPPSSPPPPTPTTPTWQAVFADHGDPSPLTSLWSNSPADSNSPRIIEPSLPPLFLSLPLTRTQLRQLPTRPIKQSVEEFFPPLSSDGPARSSPIRGTHAEQLGTIRKKAQVKRAATINLNGEVNTRETEAKKDKILDGILETLVSNGLGLGHLLFHVFDPVYRKGDHRWSFFKETGTVTRLLNLWVSMKNSATARAEVHGWAVGYMSKVLKHEAATVTKSKDLQGSGRPVDAPYILGFDMDKLHSFLDKTAPSAMALFRAFSTSARNVKNASEARLKRRRNVSFPVCDCDLDMRLNLNMIDYNISCPSILG